MSDALEIVIDELAVPGGYVDPRALAIAVAARLDDLLAERLAGELPRNDLAAELARVVAHAIAGPSQ